VLATRFGTEAVAALADGGRDIMVALRGDRIERAPLGDLPTEPRRVDPRGEHVTASRSVGTVFGDEAPT
jgi:6-phosphofructokinase